MAKNILLCCLFVCFTLSTQAQEWLTDFDEAKRMASENDRKIIMVFQESDSNGLCTRLNKEMWTNPEFMDYAKEHYIMLKVDFPRRHENMLSDEQLEKNKKLAEKYNTSSDFPHVVVLDKTGEVLGYTGYKKIPPYMYIKLLNYFDAPNE